MTANRAKPKASHHFICLLSNTKQKQKQKKKNTFYTHNFIAHIIFMVGRFALYVGSSHKPSSQLDKNVCKICFCAPHKSKISFDLIFFLSFFMQCSLPAISPLTQTFEVNLLETIIKIGWSVNRAPNRMLTFTNFSISHLARS